MCSIPQNYEPCPFFRPSSYSGSEAVGVLRLGKGAGLSRAETGQLLYMIGVCYIYVCYSV